MDDICFFIRNKANFIGSLDGQLVLFSFTICCEWVFCHLCVLRKVAFLRSHTRDRASFLLLPHFNAFSIRSCHSNLAITPTPFLIAIKTIHHLFRCISYPFIVSSLVIIIDDEQVKEKKKKSSRTTYENGRR